MGGRARDFFPVIGMMVGGLVMITLGRLLQMVDDSHDFEEESDE